MFPFLPSGSGGRSGSISVSLPPLQARVEQNGTSSTGWLSDAIPTVWGRRRKYGAIILRPVLQNIAVAGSDATSLPPLAASLAGTVTAPATQRVAVLVVSPERRPRGRKARVVGLVARSWGNAGDVAVQFGPLAASLDGRSEYLAALAGTLGPLSVSAAGVVVNPIGGDLATTLPALGMTATDIVATGRTFFVEC